MSFESIRTERLLLRPVRPTDAPALAERRSNPEVASLQSWTVPYPLEKAEHLIAEVAEMDGPVTDTWWMLTIADLADTTILGDLAIHPTWDGRTIEIGYTLASSAWGQGSAREAVAGLVARLFADERVTRLQAMMHPDNVASAQVVERCGFVFEGRTLLSYWVGDDNTDDLIYGLTRDQWTTWTTRERRVPDEVRLIEIDATNASSVAQLVTHKSQERFVAPVAQSFGDALFPEVVNGAPVVPWFRAVEADGTLVGFVMLSLITDHHREPSLWRLLVDRRHQRRGIGRRVVEQAIEECRTMGAESMTVYWCEGRGSPKPLYLQLGFVETGEIVHGETEARLSLRS